MSMNHQATLLADNQRTKRQLTFEREIGPLVVDVWEPRLPSGKTPVLLVHGWGGTGSYWRQTAFDLSETVQVIVPDLPGTGRSQPVATAQNMYDQVDTLVYLLDALELDRVQLVGHSMGGAMSLLLAEKVPDRIERVVLTSLSFFLTEQQKNIYRTVMQVFRVSLAFRPNWLTNVPMVPEAMASRYFHRVPMGQAILRQGLQDFLDLDADTAMACANNADDESIPEAGAKVQVPVLLIACRQDNVMPLENVSYTAETIPDCQVRWIDQCGHLPMVEQPDVYQAYLQDFLDL